MLAASLLLGLTLSFASHAAQFVPKSDWSQPVTSYLKNVRDNPQQVLDDILSDLHHSKDDKDLASLYFVMSRAYSSLMLHEKAQTAASNGLSVISESSQPKLYNYLQLANAEALKGLGRAREGELQVTDTIRWADAHQSYDLLAYAYSVAGYMSLTLSETDEALSNFQKGYRLAEAKPLHIAPEDFSGMIALVYEYRDEPSLAIPYFEQAQAFYRESEQRLELANTLFGLGRSHLKLNHTETGLKLLMESARLALDIRDIQGAAYSYQQISEQLIKAGQLIEAKDYLDDALSLFQEAKNPYQQIGVLLLQARIALIENNSDRAIFLIQAASRMAVGDAFLPPKIQINYLKAEALAAQRSFEEAYHLLLNMLEDERTLRKEQNSQRLIKLKSAFDIEQQRDRNALLQEQNLRQQTELEQQREKQRYTALVVTLLVIICLLLFWQYRISRKHQSRLENLANHDSLTGLLTRRKTMQDVEQQLNLAHRHNDEISIAILDLDYFKQINDTHGHQAGDDVLKGFASLAHKTFRNTDILGRVGGEEFLFTFPHTSAEDAYTLLSRFSLAVKQIPKTIGRESLTLSVSVGLVSGQHSQNVSTLIAMADEALYDAKTSGRDQIKLHALNLSSDHDDSA